MIVTTSWDDGHKLDLRLRDLLKKYGIKGTFYITPNNHEIAPADRLTPEGIKEIAREFEIGAHTMTHPILTDLTLKDAKNEIVESKLLLEKIIKKPVRSFCYTAGIYNTQIKEIVRNAGFTYARTVEQLWHTTERGAFDAPTTVHTFSHWFDLFKIARFSRWNPIRFIRYLLHWDKLAIDLFDHAKKNSGVYHLWGHSWELDRRGDWDRLERVLKYIHDHADGVDFRTNEEIADLYTSKRRVLTVTPYFPPFPGGLEKYAYKLTTGLVDQYGWDAHVLTTTQADKDDERLKVHTMKPTFKLSNTPVGILWPIKVRMLIRRLRPDMFYVHMPVPGLGDIASRLSQDMPLVIAYHLGSMKKGKRSVDWLIGWYESSILPKTLSRAGALIASSKFVRDDILADYGNVRVITPGVSVKSFAHQGFQKRSGVLFVGNYSSASSHKGLLQAMETISKIESKPELTVVGQSNITDWYKKKAKELGVSVHFAGVLNEAEIIKRYHAASVLVLPSSMESYPMVIAEAMAAGLPVVAYNVGGIKEMVQDGKTGYLLQVDDVAGLQGRLAAILDNPKMAETMGRTAAVWAAKHLDWSQKTEATEQLFDELLRGKQ